MNNLVQLISINNKESNTVLSKFVQCWLTHCLWPQRCVHDPGTESTGPEFQTPMDNFPVDTPSLAQAEPCSFMKRFFFLFLSYVDFVPASNHLVLFFPPIGNLTFCCSFCLRIQ